MFTYLFFVTIFFKINLLGEINACMKFIEIVWDTNRLTQSISNWSPSKQDRFSWNPLWKSFFILIKLTLCFSVSWTKKASPLSPSFMCSSTGSPLISMSICRVKQPCFCEKILGKFPSVDLQQTLMRMVDTTKGTHACLQRSSRNKQLCHRFTWRTRV